MLALSIIIPSYNRASLLERTLSSLTRQTGEDFQVILVDHGSTDNTWEVCQKYQRNLPLHYYRLPRDEHFAPGIPRDFGVQQAQTPFIVFLDAGMVVPSWYVTAHQAFHCSHKEYVGIGLQHGHRRMNGFMGEERKDPAEELAELLAQTDIDQVYPLLRAAQLHDKREEVQLEQSHFPWFFGWTANLSLPRDAYQSIGGFDQALKGWGLEDLELCYRLYKQGLPFAQVENGWGIELPQSRAPIQERIKSNERNMSYCYTKHRSLALESLLFAGMEHIKAEEVLHHLTGIKHNDTKTLPGPLQSQIDRPSLLVGGSSRDADFYDYVAVGDEGISSTSTVWSCSGILLPLEDHSLDTVVVTDIWKQLGWSIYYFLGLRSVSLLERLVSEVRRTAKRAIFTYSPSPEDSEASFSALEKLCQQYNLPFQVVPLE